MAYTETPMQNFNRSNPFIILAKKRYDAIIDEIQNFSKFFIKNNIRTAALLLLSIIWNLVLFYIHKINIAYTIELILFILAYIYINFYFYHRISFYLKEHEIMKKFDELSSLQMNQILTLNNEDILNCLYGMNILYGELLSEFKYGKKILFGFFLLLVCIIILSILLFFI